MTDKQYEAEKKRINVALTKWLDKLFLVHWKIKVNFERDNFETYHKGGEKLVDENVIACISPDDNYLTATLTFFLRVTKSRTDEEIEEDVVHELMHVFVAPMSNQENRKSEERTVVGLARTFLRIDKQHEKTISKLSK